MRTTQKNIQNKVKIIPKRFEGGVKCCEVFASMGSNVDEKLKNSQRNQKMWFFFSKVSISTLVQPQLKFERNLLNRFWDNCDTDDGRMTDDGQKPHTMHELCWHSQAELKNRSEIGLWKSLVFQLFWEHLIGVQMGL